MKRIPKGAVVLVTWDDEQYQGQIVEVLQGGLSVKVRFADATGQRHEVWRLASEVKVVAR